jgi:hypothetical protein
LPFLCFCTQSQVSRAEIDTQGAAHINDVIPPGKRTNVELALSLFVFFLCGRVNCLLFASLLLAEPACLGFAFRLVGLPAFASLARCLRTTCFFLCRFDLVAECWLFSVCTDEYHDHTNDSVYTNTVASFNPCLQLLSATTCRTLFRLPFDCRHESSSRLLCVWRPLLTLACVRCGLFGAAEGGPGSFVAPPVALLMPTCTKNRWRS